MTHWAEGSVEKTKICQPRDVNHKPKTLKGSNSIPLGEKQGAMLLPYLHKGGSAQLMRLALSQNPGQPYEAKPIVITCSKLWNFQTGLQV